MLFMCERCGLELASPFVRRAHQLSCDGSPPEEAAPLPIEPEEIPARLARVLTAALAAGGAEARRAFTAMMTMGKIDVAAIEAARRG